MPHYKENRLGAKVITIAPPQSPALREALACAAAVRAEGYLPGDTFKLPGLGKPTECNGAPLCQACPKRATFAAEHAPHHRPNDPRTATPAHMPVRAYRTLILAISCACGHTHYAGKTPFLVAQPRGNKTLEWILSTGQQILWERANPTLASTLPREQILTTMTTAQCSACTPFLGYAPTGEPLFDQAKAEAEIDALGI